ncbi:WxcM-like domain-containing protein [Litoribacter ruber]|uniref:WxcM-like domain-containing protein n=1 Tax=Litoribacter ruber TaxID=702568 RepID=UPI001BDB1665|nr:WxcM-like domain-containing protein [Litoribacter ruber]MBT0812917.1 WxcM-like domain-containing protein [Litoribacter ruber]
MKPQLIKGDCFKDDRGTLTYNNAFDISEGKRIYTITNKELGYKRGWQGHQIEHRWFSAMTGSFLIQTVTPNNWEQPSKDLEILDFIVCSEKLDVLHVPAGNITLITALETNSKLLVMADHLLGEVKDEYRYNSDYFSS